MDSIIYKIVPRGLWQTAESDGSFRGSPLDRADGFIHLSAPNQTVETAAKHFAGQSDLLLVTVNAAAIGETLRWEESRGGDLFPHIYGELPLSAVVDVQPLPLAADGQHEFPEDFRS